MFVGKSVLLNWLNSALQLRLEKVEDVSTLLRQCLRAACGGSLAGVVWRGVAAVQHPSCPGFLSPTLPPSPAPCLPDLQRRGGLPADGLPAPGQREFEEGGLQRQKRL